VRAKGYLLPIAAVAMAMLAWELSVGLFEIPSFILPSLGSIASAMVDNRWAFLSAMGTTLLETIVGFVIATVLGIGIAIMFIWIRPIRDALYPLILVVQAMPKIAVAPLLVVWLGPTDLSAKILMVVLISFFPVVISTMVGLEATEPELIDLFRSMGGSRFQTFSKLQLPGAVPQIMSGLKVAVTLAVTGALVGELMGGNRGLGYLINVASGQIDTAMMFADLVILTAMAVGLFYAIDGLDRVLNRWKERGTTISES
jgi:NitT/TauT family transport system permease protein